MEPLVADKSPSDGATMCERMTRSGRYLVYHLDVIQQPERARACGSGPKSTSDRRPVDPPPVVELRIFEGQRGQRLEDLKDITFTYNANFFLFATLEHARVIAHARGQPPQASTPPVLTGMPVSGMAYLDRPQEAGYFLFPDLSVRHEGRYRLAFNLYEETKEDRDKDPDNGEPQGASFDWRMELKSADFTVFSAKKFPGLATSTNLSRTMAEQGTRVRIRRDVRMRRRDGKGGAEPNGAEDASRRQRSQTPDSQHKDYRSRSMSGSTDRAPLSAADSQRRPSNADFRPPPPPPPPPGFPAAQVSQPSHVTYGPLPSHYVPPPPPPPPPSSSGRASPVPHSPSYPQYTHSAYAPPTPTTYHDRRMSTQTVDHQRQYPNPSPKHDQFPDRRLSSASYAGRPMTPQSAGPPPPSPTAAVRLPGIGSLLSNDKAQAESQTEAPPASQAPLRQIQAQPPHTSYRPRPILPQPSLSSGQILRPPSEIPGLAPEHRLNVLWFAKNTNGKRCHPDTTLIYAAERAKNHDRPEERRRDADPYYAYRRANGDVTTVPPEVLSDGWATLRDAIPPPRH